MLRKVIFWFHFCLGAVAGVFVFLMSLTGLLLEFESQITTWFQRRAVADPGAAPPLDADAMIAAARAAGAHAGQALVLAADPGTPASFSAGRGAGTLLDPYSGAVLQGAGDGAQAFFQKVMFFHRWLSLDGMNTTGKLVNDAANLLFLGLVISGLYLWLPPLWKWTRLKMSLFFRRGLPSAQARHYNWHQVFGIWALVPLFLVVLSGVVMSYSWANTAIYTLIGEAAPQQSGRGRPGGDTLPAEYSAKTLAGTPLSWTALVEDAAVAVPGWKTASIALPAPDAAYVQMTLDAGNGAQAWRRQVLILDRSSGEIVAQSGAASQSLGGRIRAWMRWVHTGEVYGLPGQVIGALACIAAMMLVYTGWSLGIRRLGRMARKRATRRA